MSLTGIFCVDFSPFLPILLHEVVGVLWLSLKLVLDLEILSRVLEVMGVVDRNVHWEESVWDEVLVDLLWSNEHILLTDWGDEVSVFAIVSVIDGRRSVPLELKITVIGWLISELDEHILGWNVLSLDRLNGGCH